jgi:anti-anti-sigma factor
VADSRIETVEVGSVAALTLVGEHDLATESDLAEAIGRVARPGTAMVIDLSPTTFIDSTVLRVLVSAAEEADVVAVVASVASRAARLLSLTAVGDRLSVCESTDQALRRVLRVIDRSDRNAAGELLCLVDRLLDVAWQAGTGAEQMLAVARELSLMVGREPLIEDVKLLIAQAQGCTPSEAFERLVRVSQQRNEKLADVARRLAEATTDERPPWDMGH